MMAARVMLIHSHAPILNMDGSTPAHAFGPFESHEDAVAFDAVRPDDCYKTTVNIVGPDPEDVARSAEGEVPTGLKQVN